MPASANVFVLLNTSVRNSKLDGTWPTRTVPKSRPSGGEKVGSTTSAWAMGVGLNDI
jgi:hypothetical protein